MLFIFQHSNIAFVHLLFYSMNLITTYWLAFVEQYPEYSHFNQPESFYFGDSKLVADECAWLVENKIKRATSPSLWWFKKNRVELPQIDNLGIVTNWAGEPKAIIKTTRIEITKFKDISPAYAEVEGEGDKSLRYWREEHWKYYQNEMEPYGESPNEDLEIVCEYFETIG